MMKKILTLSLALIVSASVCTVSAGKKKDKKTFEKREESEAKIEAANSEKKAKAKK